MKQIALDIGLAPEPTLGDYVAGRNEEALAHVRLWASDTALRSPAPLYLWGEAGSGKTHLLRAARQALERAGSRVGWLGAQTPPLAFDARWDAVIFDDAHLYNAERQHAAFNWFVSAVSPPQGGAPRGVLAAGRLPPADLPLREDLRTRLGWGHVFELHVPTEAERRAVLRRAADARGLMLSDQAMDFVLTRFARDLGSLMQLLEALDAYALQTRRPITIPLLKEWLENS